MELSEEDFEAFHSQASRVIGGVENDVNEVSRQEREKSVRSVITYSYGDEMDMIVLKILPRHRFYVDVIGGEYFRSYRRDEIINFIEDVIS